jgi:nitroimidazol reductase NimA-like FMN-containing flavoprotein (pyridoxamine 5'-phosphate oxidase superfamily)
MTLENARIILAENILGTIATVNEDGSPWSTPVHIFSDGESVYWFSYEDKVHSINIERDPRVSLTLFSPDESRGPKGIYLNGPVTKLDDEATTSAKQLMVAKIGKVPSYFEHATGYKLEIGQLNSSKTTGNCWYFYS